MATGELAVTSSTGLSVLKGIAAVVAVLVAGRYAVGPLLHAVARIGSSDAFVALALLVVLGFAWIMTQVGLSLAMGAFMAGVMLADSEYRHQIEADILPFRGLLLGLFFMGVGMSIDPTAVIDQIGLVAGATVVLLLLKAVLLTGLSLLWKMPMATALRTGFLLSQAGEFGFVLFTQATEHWLLAPDVKETLVTVIVLSMAATPGMMWIGNRLAERFAGIGTGTPVPAVADDERPVLIAGFGRVGETVANMLLAANVPYVAIDADADRVAHARRRGYHVFFGSAARPEVLRSVGAAHARLMVVTLDDHRAAEGLVRTARRLYPDVPIHVRAHDWEVVDTFKALGVAHAMPETVEASLRLGAAALEAAGVPEEERRALFEDMIAEDFARMRRFARR